MKIYAHRGLHHHVAENTMAAFLRAEIAGVDGIETDLRTTADRRVVLYHDRTFRGRAVSDYGYDELRSATGVDVPLLDHVLERSWRVSWNFEIKTRAAGEIAADMLRGAAPPDTILSSFDHDAVHEATRATGLPGALLFASLPSERDDLPLPNDLVRTLVWDWNVVRPEAIERAAYLDWRSMVYGPVTAGEHAALELLRPWGVITDHPALVPQATWMEE